MKKSLLLILAIFGFMTAKAQIGVWSLTYSPVPNSTDLQLNIRTYCGTVHYINSSTVTSNGSDHIINLCYTVTPLLMITDIVTPITLAGLNNGSIQNFTINVYYYDNLQQQNCSGATSINSFNHSLNTPLTEPLILSLEEYRYKKTTLFPNPNSGEFALQLPTDGEQANVTITDLSGKKVYQKTDYISGNLISLRGLTKGLYFAKIIGNLTTETLKFIIQ